MGNYRLAADYNVQGGNFAAPGLHGCAGCTSGCKCKAGLGCSCNKGMGLFDSGMDFTSWTWQEWMVVGLGGYVVVSMLFTTRRAARQIGEGVRSRVKRTRRRMGSAIAGAKV